MQQKLIGYMPRWGKRAELEAEFDNFHAGFTAFAASGGARVQIGGQLYGHILPPGQPGGDNEGRR